MKQLRITPRGDRRLYAAMVKRQAEIRRSGRGTFSRAGRKRAGAARWTHVRYKGSIDLVRGDAEIVVVTIKSSDHGDEARLLSAFLGWLDRHFGDAVRNVNIEYR
jgi:hypothetical protein